MRKVNGIAKGQYKHLCKLSWSKCEGNEDLLTYKIQRAIDLGKVIYTYKNDCKIIRYHYLNFLVSEDEIMTVWKDISRPAYKVSEKMKRRHEKLTNLI